MKCMGEPFDPTYHEALGTLETNKVKPGHIADVFRKAFKFHDKLIRPAQVIIATEEKKEKNVENQETKK